MSSEILTESTKFFLTSLRLPCRFLDVQLVDKEGRKHPMSKCILAVHSTTLHKMFCYGIDRFQEEYHLPTISGETIDIIFEWMVSGKFNLYEMNVLDVLEAAEYLNISCLSTLCQEWLIERISVNNVVGFWRYSLDHFLEVLKKSSLDFLTQNFPQVVEEEEFLELPIELLLLVLRSDDLSFDEKIVWEALLMWEKNHRNFLTENLLLNSVRFGLLDEGYFHEDVLPVLKSYGIEEVVEQALQCGVHPFHKYRPGISETRF